MPPKIPEDQQSSRMRWIAFAIISILFATTGAKAIFTGQPTDNIISGIFVIVIGGAWGANFFDKFLKR